MMTKPCHPGEILKAGVFDELGITVIEGARRLGVSRVALSRVLNGHAGISPSLALRLEAAGVSTARAWLAMQSAYDLATMEEHFKVEPLVAVA
ncbi:MAG: HigA family addiction module antitoxin [Promicromonosporaceae bacterium]|nr:HigA family addiction module antitoxin [Promicromonosporaceae bacterium]